MWQTVDRLSKRQHNKQNRRQFLRRLAGLAAVFVGLGTMGEASADWSLLAPKPSEFGGFTSRPVVGRNEDGRLEVFLRGVNPIYPLMHVWQLTGGGWSHTNNLGGTVTSNIAVANNLDGRLEVFVRGTDNSLFHRWQTTPNGDWGEFSPLGGILWSDPTVTRNWDGRMETFHRNTDNGVSHRWQVTPNGDWSGWENFADTVGLVTGNVAAIATNSGGGLNLFWRGPDNRLRWKRQTTANGAWGAPRSLGGPIIASDITVAEFDGQRSDARLVVFVRDTNNVVWYLHQMQPNGTTWSNWISLGGQFIGNVAVGRNWDGRLDLWVRAPNNFVYHTFQRETDSTASWNGWSLFGGILHSDVGVGMNRDRRLEIFGIGIDGALWHRWQVTPGGAWS
jgi:hypothetical protein